MSPDIALSLLSTHLGSHGLAALGWTGALDTAHRRFGSCSPRTKRITLSRHLATINTDEETLDTVLHEIAHALAWIEHDDDCGHDERWQAIAARIGARPERTVDAEETNSVAGAFYLVHGDTGEVFRSLYKRPNEQDVTSGWIRGRQAETQGNLIIITARELAHLQGEHHADENPDLIRSFDKPTVRDLSGKLTAAIARVCAEHGLSVEFDGGRFDPESYHCGYVLRVAAEHAVDGDRSEFAVYAHLFQLTIDDFGRLFALNGQAFSLVGLKPQNRKYPIIGRDASGRRLKFPATVLAELQ